jgi:hypothetical protein
MDDVTEEMLTDKLVICVSRAGVLRGYRCDWWIIGSFWHDADVALPDGVKVVANGKFLKGRTGYTTRALGIRAGLPRPTTLATDALKLAWRLGHQDIAVWGADWCGKTHYRWFRESREWREAIVKLGLKVT